jgi:coenzyme F420-reducing hydrogenase delta subunit
MGIGYPENIRLIRLPCAGRLSVLHILKAFESGADGVLVLACPQDSCYHISGNLRAEEKVREANALLAEIGMDGGRVLVFNIGPPMAHRFAEIMSEAAEKIKGLGPSPFRGA